MDPALRDQQCGADAFAYASDYPHGIDLVAVKEMIRDTVERPDLRTLRRLWCWAATPRNGLGSEISSLYRSKSFGIGAIALIR